MLPGTEAIEEEDGPENVTRVGMFKRNSNFDEEQEKDKILRKNEGETQARGVGKVGSASYSRKDSTFQQRIMSGTSQPTAMQKH